MKFWTSTTGRTRLEVQVTMWSVEITATTPIGAAAEQVWEALADTDRYPEWNPFVRSLSGHLAVGGRLQAVLQPADKPQKMRPRLVEVTPGRSFTWLGHVVMPGVLDGRHHFAVRAMAEDRTSLVQRERLTGLLVPAFRSMLTGDTPRAFAAMNDALAARAEAPGPAPAVLLAPQSRGR
jgi:hypothetical protein